MHKLTIHKQTIIGRIWLDSFIPFQNFSFFAFIFVRGKKRKGLTAYRHTWIDDTDGYLIEDLDKRWRLPAVDIVSSVQAVPEDEIQEVTVEMGNENPKPSGM